MKTCLASPRNFSAIALSLPVLVSWGCGGADDGPPTFYEDVAPILYANCVSCHTAGGVAPFMLETYEEVKPLAALIADKTASREMPPWHIDSSGDCGKWNDARVLTEAQISTIAAWAHGGVLEGDPSHVPPRPQAPHLDEVSMTIDIGTTYTPDASVQDDYRCFMFSLNLPRDRYLTGYQIRPTAPSEVHHVVFYQAQSLAVEEEAAALDAADARPGYSCFGSVGSEGVDLIGGWGPGTPVTYWPEGTGLLLKASRKVIMQVHYNLANGALPDRTAMDLKLADSVKTVAYIVALDDKQISLPPGQKSVTSSVDLPYPAPYKGEIHAAFPHMHQLGRTITTTVLRDGKELCLNKTLNWNFHWQQFYSLEDPFVLLPGDTLRVRCTYDTTEKKTVVHYGDTSQDEMCADFVYWTH